MNVRRLVSRREEVLPRGATHHRFGALAPPIRLQISNDKTPSYTTHHTLMLVAF